MDIFSRRFLSLRFSSLLQRYSSWELQKKKKLDFLKKLEVRFEEYTPLGKSVMKGITDLSFPHVTFKIMDYNILSQTHMKTHIRNYQKCPRECLNWDYRKSVLKEELLAEKPDLIINISGFDALYVHRGEGKPDGCAILYKTDLFRAVDFTPVHFMRSEVALLDRPNVGMVARLELKKHPGNFLVVANTHLLYNPRRVDIKMCQLQILLAEMDRIAYNSGRPNKYHPMILTGDLNVNSNSGLISLLKDGFVDCRNLYNKRWRTVTTADGEEQPSELLQKHLNISDSCQYMNIVEARKKGLQVPRTKDLENILQKHRVYAKPCLGNDGGVEPIYPNQNSTVANTSENPPAEEFVDTLDNKRTYSHSLSHHFRLMNVYDDPRLDKVNHKSTRNSEKKLNVYDYMFYSGDIKLPNLRPPFELRMGQLQLLSRLRLPSVPEYYSQIQTLPNYACGSDHLPLTATFLFPVQ